MGSNVRQFAASPLPQLALKDVIPDLSASLLHE